MDVSAYHITSLILFLSTAGVDCTLHDAINRIMDTQRITYVSWLSVRLLLYVTELRSILPLLSTKCSVRSLIINVFCGEALIVIIIINSGAYSRGLTRVDHYHVLTIKNIEGH